MPPPSLSSLLLEEEEDRRNWVVVVVAPACFFGNGRRNDEDKDGDVDDAQARVRRCGDGVVIWNPSTTATAVVVAARNVSIIIITAPVVAIILGNEDRFAFVDVAVEFVVIDVVALLLLLDVYCSGSAPLPIHIHRLFTNITKHAIAIV